LLFITSCFFGENHLLLFFLSFFSWIFCGSMASTVLSWSGVFFFAGGSSCDAAAYCVSKRAIFLDLGATEALYSAWWAGCNFKWRNQFDGFPKCTLDLGLQYSPILSTFNIFSSSLLALRWTILKSFGIENF